MIEVSNQVIKSTFEIEDLFVPIYVSLFIHFKIVRRLRISHIGNVFPNTSK